MPIWWVGLVGIIGLVAGYIFNIDGLKFFGVLSLAGAVLGLLRALIFRR